MGRTGRGRRENLSPLIARERVWRERYPMLESHGYRLRQRYKPDWTPSWFSTKRTPFRHEDYHWCDNDVTMDAVRISDGRKVFLKRVRSKNNMEIAIHRFLSEPERLDDPRNHTAPLLDVFVDDDDPQFSYMVLPFLHRFYEPRFYFVDEFVDFVRQLLQGIHYMHDAGVAHRDCSVLNIMMDGDALYPNGIHPTSSVLNAAGDNYAYPKRRRDVGGVRYYFIDFGISSKFDSDRPRKVIGDSGQDRDVPELSFEVWYDPFLTDVFIIGNLIRKHFVKRYTNLDFLSPLVERMTAIDPQLRCTSAEAEEIFERIISEQPRLALRWRLKERTSGPITQLFQDAGTLTREYVLIAKTTLASKYRAAAHFLLHHLKVKQRN